MFDMPVIEHCEEQTLKGDGVAHEGFQASTLGLRGIPGRGRVDHGAARHLARRADRRRRPHRAHERAADARRGPLRQGARRARHLRGDAASLRADRRDARRAGAVRHQRQDEPAAARGGRSRRDARRASPTAASTSSPPTTRRITTTRSTSSSTTRRSASPGSRPPCRSASIGSCIAGVDRAVAAGRAAVGEPGADPRACRAARWRRARRPTSRSSRPDLAVTVSAARDAVEVEEHAVRRLDSSAAASRRRSSAGGRSM